jgi:hypothetical protein
MGPGRLLAHSGCLPLGAARNWAWFVLGHSRDRLMSVSLIVGRSCWRWHLGPGVYRDVPFGPGHLRRCIGRRRCDTPGTSGIRRECWSRGRIVSALLSGAQGGCLPSMEPPNPDAATMGTSHAAHKSSSAIDTGLHQKQWVFMKGASWSGAGRFWARAPLQLQRAGGRRSGRMALRGELGCRRTRTR